MNDIKERIEKAEIFFKERDLFIYNDTYKNARTRVSLIDSIGYKYCSTSGSLKNSKGKPDKISTHNPYTIENLRLWLKLNKPLYTLVSTVYEDSHKLLKFNCKIHGEFKMNWTNLSQGQEHSIKHTLVIHPPIKKFDIDDVKAIVHDRIPTITVTANEWINSSHKIACHCDICGKEWDAWYSNLRKGEGCPVCGLRKGKNHGGWKGGLTPLINHLRSFILPWKMDSFNFYKSICCITGVKIHKEILIHHKYGFNMIVQDTINELNLPIYDEINKYTSEELKLLEDKCLELHYKHGLGVCICRDVHNKFHKIYGRGDNTPEQWDEFIRNFYTK